MRSVHRARRPTGTSVVEDSCSNSSVYSDFTIDSTPPSPVITAASRWKSVKALTRRFLPAIVLFCIYTTLLVLFIVYFHQILAFFESIAEQLRQWHIFGALLVVLLVQLTAIPLVPGYGTLTTLCGFIYGFPLGFAPAFIGALTGSTAVFLLTRRYGGRWLAFLLRRFGYLKAIVHVVETRGFKLLVLMRLAPYPFNLMNAALAATNISATAFATATAISLFKLLLHIFIGANLNSLVNDPLAAEKNPLNLAFVIAGILLGIGLSVYVWWAARKIVRGTAVDEEVEIQKTNNLMDGFASGTNPFSSRHAQ